MPEIARIIGAAGSGKTTALLDILEKLIGRGVEPTELGFVSFTRAAREVAVARVSERFGVAPYLLERDGWFRTLHSCCYRILGIPSGMLLTDDAASRKWMTANVNVETGTSGYDALAEMSFDLTTPEGVALQLWQKSRLRLEPYETTYLAAVELDFGGRMLGLGDAVSLVERYEQAKRLEDRCDFSDILGRFAGARFRPRGAHEERAPEGDPPPLVAWLFDEQQDTSALLDLVCKRLCESARWVYVVGDPFQCQPAGTPVLTQAGYKPIELLDESDSLIAFDVKDGRFYGKAKRIKFQRATRFVDSGQMIEIETEDGTKHVATENHKWVCRTLRGDWWAVYLMRKGNRWRVGTVQMFAGTRGSKNGEFRLGMRCNQEQADAAWVLGVFTSDRDARAQEQIVSCRWGIPQITFRPVWGASFLKRDFIDEVFGKLGDLTPNGERCLRDLGLCVDHPYWTKRSNRKNGAKASRLIVSCNLLPGITLLPKLTDEFRHDARAGKRNGVRNPEENRNRRRLSRQVEWHRVVSVKRLASGVPTQVYSLNVEKYHTYVSKEFVTGNSIYGFAGSDHRLFMAWDASKQRVMEKSWRCPAPILELGERILSGCSDYWDRGVAPADHSGEVEYPLDVMYGVESVRASESWLLLARTNRAAQSFAAWLKSRGIPYLSTRGGSPWSAPKRSKICKLFRLLQSGCAITGAEWKDCLAEIPSKFAGYDLLVRGAKTRWAEMSYQEGDAAHPVVAVADPEIVPDSHPACVRAIRSGDWKLFIDGAAMWCDAAETWGEEIAENPRVRIGTVHSVKGDEADNVLWDSNLNYRIDQSLRLEESQGACELRDEELRLGYVAVTRARKRLLVCGGGQFPLSY